MKRVLVIFIMVLFLSSCANTPQSDFGDNPTAVSFRWTTDNGTYFTSTSQYLAGNEPGHNFGPGDYDDFIDDPLLLYINDTTTGNNILLCNRPDCAHESRSCNAYLPYDTYYDSRQTDLRKTSIVFVDGEYVYAHNAGSCIYRFNLDGTERTLAVPLYTKYFAFSNGWLMNGKLYVFAEAIVPTGDFDISMTLVNGLLEIDYLNGECRELWVGEPDPRLYNDISIYAINDGKFYFLEKIYPYNSRDRFSDDNERLDFYDNTEYILFSVDSGDDEPQADIIYTGMGHDFNPCERMYVGAETQTTDSNLSIYYHSRREESVFRLDLITGESVEVIDTVPGTMQIIGLFGGRLFMVDFMRDYEIGRRVDVDVVTGFTKTGGMGKMYEMLLYVDLSTGEMSQSTFTTKRTLVDGGFTGNTDGFTEIIYEEDGYFYIEIERIEMESDVWGDGREIYIYLDKFLVGRIPIEDYFIGNFNALENIGWVSVNEFIVMRGGT